MSLFIKDANLPESGSVLLVYADGSMSKAKTTRFGISDLEAIKAKAVPLPEGHGDLIERKRLDLVPDYKDVRNGIKHIVKETKRDGRVIAGISIELLVQTLVALDELRSVRRYFENAKTIIPAEGGPDDV